VHTGTERRCFVVALTTVIAAIAVPLQRAEACSCAEAPSPGFFFAANGDTLPKGARGIVWWSGSHGEYAHHWAKRLCGPDAANQQFVVERIEGTKRTPVEFSVEPLGSELFLVKPAGPKTGQRFRFASLLPVLKGCEMFSRWPGDWPLEASVEVVWGAAAVPLKAKANLQASRHAKESLTVLSVAGDCQTTLSAEVVDLEVDLDLLLRPFKTQLVYTTFVDGEPWRAQSSLCETVTLGRSWMGEPGKDRVFSVCKEEGQELGKQTQLLSAGKHKVAMELRLPGEGVVFRTPDVVVDLDCGLTKGAAPACP